MAETNMLLQALPDAVRDRIEEAAEEIRFGRGDLIVERGTAFEFTVFPLTAVLSVLTVMEDGTSIEAATIGREGLLGYPLVFGVATWSTRCVCQVEGTALAVPGSLMESVIRDSPEALELSRQYNSAVLVLVAQTAGCNRAHPLEERMARWLLTMEDRMGERDLVLTQEFLAQMLGVHRPSVTVAAGILQQAGLITYRYGRVGVLNRRGLEEAACECYAITAEQFAQLYR